jgi:hypothetical protein
MSKKKRPKAQTMKQRHKALLEATSAETYPRARIAALEIEVEELLRKLDGNSEVHRLRRKVAILTDERDDARREVCCLKACDGLPQEYASLREWDCFDERDTNLVWDREDR